MRRVMLGVIAVGSALALAASAGATPNFNLTGQGARALGMGGAFIAIADDATAISWNPAGLAQLDRPELSTVLKFETLKAGYDPQNVTLLGSDLPLGAEESESHFVVNFASGVFPITVREHNLAFAVAFQQQLDYFARSEERDTLGRLTSSETTKGGVNTIAPALAYQISSQFALGAAANIWTGSPKTTYESDGSSVESTQPYSGLNFLVGGWGHAKPMKFGAVLRTPLTLKYHDEASGDTWESRYPQSGDYKTKLPLMFGVGVAVEPTQNLTVAADVDFRPYSNMEFLDSADVADTAEASFLKNITQLRVGAEYLLMLDQGVIPLRAGFRTDPRPYTGWLVDADGNFVTDGDQVSGTVFSFGTGFVTKNFQLDGALELGSSKQPLTWDPVWEADPATWDWKETSMRFLVSGILRF
jgi:long-subunit fatty acid transport protein